MDRVIFVARWAGEKLFLPVMIPLVVMYFAGVFGIRKDVEKSRAGTDAAQQRVAAVEKRVERVEGDVTTIIKTQEQRGVQRVAGSKNQAVNVTGSNNTATQVGTLNVSPAATLRNDPLEAKLLLRRITEGEALSRELSPCRHDEARLGVLVARVQAWVDHTASDLRKISAVAEQQFRKLPPARGLWVLTEGCNAQAADVKYHVDIYVNNLRGVLAGLGSEKH